MPGPQGGRAHAREGIAVLSSSGVGSQQSLSFMAVVPKVPTGQGPRMPRRLDAYKHQPVGGSREGGWPGTLALWQ